MDQVIAVYQSPAPLGTVTILFACAVAIMALLVQSLRAENRRLEAKMNALAMRVTQTLR